MKLVSDTPLHAGWMPWRFGPNEWRLVVAVKATITLPHDGVASLADEQAFVTGDEFWEDDPERSLRYAEDLALVKPQGEVWLTGTLRTLEPVQQLACYARVGDVEMRFDVIGDRWWRSDGGQTEPTWFKEMPLCWERSFGGPGFEPNPVGHGLAPDPGDAEGRIALPNVEHHGRLMRSPRERPEPAGAWPIPRTWPERMRLMGSDYGAAYLRERWPYFAEDFRWSHFQAAREAQRVAGYWRGDEEIELARLHPEHPRLRCRLPGIRACAFVCEQARSQGPLREVPLLLDTIAVDVGEGTATLVWRGSTPCSGEAHADLSHLYVMHEPVDRRVGEGEVYTAFVSRLKAMWEEEQGLEAEAPPTSPQAAGAPEPARVRGEGSNEAEAEPSSVEALLAQERKRARSKGWPEAVIAQLFPVEPPEVDPGVRRASIEAARAAAQELGLAAVVEVLGQALERLDAADPTADAPPREAPPPGLWSSQELREIVAARMQAGESLAGLVLVEADLSLLDLSGQNLTGAVLLRADLQGATLDRAILDGAVLDGAKLAGATLREASLSDASLSFVEADGVDFTGAVLEHAIAERAMLTSARFDRVRATGLTLEECLATGASLVRANLSEAELPRTTFDEADFRHATMTGARLEGASLRRASMDQLDAAGLRASDGADLSEATLRYSMLAGASFARSTLIGTKFTESDLTRSTFAEARLEGAELLAVEAKGASFAGARMSAASLAGSNLLGVRFEGTQLTLGDLSGANLYGAEFWQAELTDVRLYGANVDGTKLA